MMDRHCKKQQQTINQRDFETQLDQYIRSMGGKKPTMAAIIQWAAPAKGKGKGKDGKGKG